VIVRLGVIAIFAAAWLLTSAAGAQTANYRLSSTAVVSLERTPQPPLVDTIVSNALVSVTLSLGADTIATMALDSLTSQSSGMVRRAPDAFSRGISITALLTNGRPLITGDSASACAVERPLAALLPELLPLLPITLDVDQQWSDTVAVTTCRAGLSVTTHAVVAYRTLAGMDSTTLLVERRTTLRAVGAAVLRTQPVELNGSGSSESLAIISRSSRRVLTLRNTQFLELVISNGVQTRRMTQRLTDVVTSQQE
jgi:hypothetical protein